jgi:hypothetical protein
MKGCVSRSTIMQHSAAAVHWLVYSFSLAEICGACGDGRDNI